MDDSNIYHIYPLNQVKIFSENEAYHIVSLLMSITAKVKNNINAYNGQLELYKNLPEKYQATQIKLNDTIQKWSDKIRRLGCVPVALYEVKIPSAHGHYIWTHPKDDIEFIPSPFMTELGQLPPNQVDPLHNQ